MRQGEGSERAGEGSAQKGREASADAEKLIY